MFSSVFEAEPFSDTSSTQLATVKLAPALMLNVPMRKT